MCLTVKTVYLSYCARVMNYFRAWNVPHRCGDNSWPLILCFDQLEVSAHAWFALSTLRGRVPCPTWMLQLYPYYTECQSMSSGVKKKRSPIASTTLIRPRQVPELPAQHDSVDSLFNGDATLDMLNSRFWVEVNWFRARIDGMWTSEHRHGSSLYVCG